MSLLLSAIFFGLLISLVRAKFKGRQLMVPEFEWLWLAPVAVAFQILILRSGTDSLVAAGLVISQAFLLLFAWFNRKQSGFSLLTFGLALNLLVITLNGGLMPITPQMVAKLNISSDFWEIGGRLGAGKDIVLPIAQTKLWVLSDRFFLSFPGNLYRVAYSPCDVLIALGVF